MTNLIIVVCVVLFLLIVFRIYRLGSLVSLAKGKDEEDTVTSANSINAALFILFMVGGLGVFFWYSYTFFDEYTLPLASEHGEETDFLFWVTMGVTVIAFSIIFVVMFVFLYLYQYKKDRQARFYPDNHYLELTWTIVPAIVLTVLIITGLSAWNRITGEASADAEVIELVGEQFAWSIRYPGVKDNQLGNYQFSAVDNGGNSLGIDLTDQNSYDDFTANELHFPVDKEVLLLIRAKDVLHSVFLPHFRVKMDAVPGMRTQFKFIPTKTTEEMRAELNDPNFNYELACTEICGSGHNAMRLTVIVDELDDYEKWKAEQKPWLQQFPEYMERVPKELKGIAKSKSGLENYEESEDMNETLKDEEEPLQTNDAVMTDSTHSEGLSQEEEAHTKEDEKEKSSEDIDSGNLHLE